MQERPLVSQSSESLQENGFAKAPFRLRLRTQGRSLRPKTHERSEGRGHCTPITRIHSSERLPGNSIQGEVTKGRKSLACSHSSQW